MTTTVTVHANGENYPAYVYKGVTEDDPQIKLEDKLVNVQKQYYIYGNQFLLVTDEDIGRKGLID